ncbi:MAG: pilus assembly protein PilM [Deltaproteobacteria bacterium]|nr:pilus assembly protein PilM [Deltaproteobacteria bacterium]
MGFRPLLERWQSPNSVGVDIGSSHCKIVQLVRGREGPRLVACGMVEAGMGADEEGAIRRMRVFLKEHGVRIGKAAVNIADPSLRIRRMDLPKMPDRDTKVAIRWNFREQVEVPLEKFVVGYTTIPEKGTEDRIPLMAYGVAAEAVARYQARGRRLGFRVSAVEPSATALLAAFDHSIGWTEGERVALLDLGFTETLFLVMGDGVLLFARSLAGVSGERLLRMAGREGSIPPDQSRAALQSVIVGEAVPEGMEKVLEEFYTQMLVELQRSIDGFAALYRVETGVQRLFLCGGGSQLPNLAAHLTKNLGVTTTLFDPFTKISDRDGQMPAAVTQGSLYAVAVGLAIPRHKGKESQ